MYQEPQQQQAIIEADPDTISAKDVVELIGSEGFAGLMAVVLFLGGLIFNRARKSRK